MTNAMMPLGIVVLMVLVLTGQLVPMVDQFVALVAGR